MTTSYCLIWDPPAWRARPSYLHPLGTRWPSCTPGHCVGQPVSCNNSYTGTWHQAESKRGNQEIYSNKYFETCPEWNCDTNRDVNLSHKSILQTKSVTTMYENKWTINETKYVLTSSAICAVKIEHATPTCMLYNMYAHNYRVRFKEAKYGYESRGTVNQEWLYYLQIDAIYQTDADRSYLIKQTPPLIKQETLFEKTLTSRKEQPYGHWFVGARHQDWLCWTGPAAIYRPASPISSHAHDSVSRQKTVVTCLAGPGTNSDCAGEFQPAPG
jgi:hypothetical protein